MPCETCKRTGRACTFTTSSNALMPVFVNEKGNAALESRGSKSAQERQTVICLPKSVGLQEHDCAFPYFFKAFLPMNVFANDESFDTELLFMARTSSTLRDAIQAVAVLHGNQQDQNSVVLFAQRRRKFEALQAYHRAVRAMQKLITSNTFLSDPSALWTTFLLGLFEVRNLGQQLIDS
jgi:hypothetical protein